MSTIFEKEKLDKIKKILIGNIINIEHRNYKGSFLILEVSEDSKKRNFEKFIKIKVYNFKTKETSYITSYNNRTITSIPFLAGKLVNGYSLIKT